MATTARDELYDLAQETNQNTNEPQDKNLSKDDVIEAIHEYSTTQQQAYEKQEQEERRRAQEAKRAQEQQALQEASQAVKEALREEMSKDKDFSKVVQETDLPGELVDYIAEVGDPSEAAGIVRELANNDEYKQTLKRSKTQIGVKRLIGKIRKDVITGGYQGKIPPMLNKNIPNYNINTTPSDLDQDYYKDLGMRHGI